MCSSAISRPARPSGRASRPAVRDILFVITTLEIGGTERQLALLAGELARSGSAITVYSFMDGVVRAQLEQAGVQVILTPHAFDPARSSALASVLFISRTAVHLLRTMFRLRPRIVHFFLPAAYLVGAPMALLARVPVRVMSRRSLNNYQRRGIVRVLERMLHRLMHVVVGNSRGVVAQLQEEGVAPERLGLIYNGIDSASFASPSARGGIRAHLGLPADALVMVIVANLIPYKAHRDLIDALALAAPNLPPNWRLLVVGRDDGIGGELRQQAKRLGLQDRISFLGARNDVAALLAASDLGILCSHEEGFSNAILEGMAAGLPMVVTDVGGNAEAVIEGETGLVVPARDPQRLAAALVRLAGDPALRAQFGKAGQERVTSRFALRQFVDNHRKLYAALSAGQRPIDVPEVRVTN